MSAIPKMLYKWGWWESDFCKEELQINEERFRRNHVVLVESDIPSRFHVPYSIHRYIDKEPLGMSEPFGEMRGQGVSILTLRHPFLSSFSTVMKPLLCQL